jgi:two-component system nitrogen regulation response regulator GlnG
MLTRSFLGKSAKELGVDAKRITDAALEQLASFDFPGNVRQLENICHWLTVMAPAQVIEAKDLPPELSSGAMPSLGTAPSPAEPSSPAALPLQPVLADAPAATAVVAAQPVVVPASWLGDLERDARRRLEAGEPGVWDELSRQFEGRLIHTALEVTRGRRIEAALKLGIGRNTITRKIQELGLDD